MMTGAGFRSVSHQDLAAQFASTGARNPHAGKREYSKPQTGEIRYQPAISCLSLGFPNIL